MVAEVSAKADTEVAAKIALAIADLVNKLIINSS